MTSYPFMQLDAFTTKPLSGNACAVVFDADSLDNATRLAIAKEMNLSETAFVVRSDTADFGARYFTPAEEIPLAGHPTIATIYALIDSGRLKLKDPLTTLSLELKVGPIPIEIRSNRGQVSQIIMSQKKPEFLRSYRAEDVLPVFGLSPDDGLPNLSIQSVSTGTAQLMIPLRRLEILRRIVLNIPAYAALRKQGDFLTPHLFCLEGATSLGQTFARDFVLPPDLIEDPFTGSATGGMGAYLWHYGLIDTPTFVAEQTVLTGRPGVA